MHKASHSLLTAPQHGPRRYQAATWSCKREAGALDRTPRFLSGLSEQALATQPAQHMDFDTFRKTGLGLGVEADFLATLASHPPEAVSRKFDSIRSEEHTAG